MHFFYQLKAKKCDHAPENCFNSPWSFPPIFTGMIEAKDRAAAHKQLETELGRKLPTRVLKKDLPANDFLLVLRPMVGTDDRSIGLFEVRKCAREECGKGFRVVDKYNDDEEYDKGWDYCSRDCREKRQQKRSDDWRADYDFNGSHDPVIYRILNIKTGKSYIGKTTQAFTLRWYQHFFQSAETKFHEAVKASVLEDWQFQVVERIECSKDRDKAAIAARRQLICDREMHWITFFNSIDDGYNTTPPKVVPQPTGMENMFDEEG